MKIATWNIERLNHHKSLDKITSICESLNADILVLTESDERVKLNYKFAFHTPTPPDFKLPEYIKPISYHPTEHRISIFTNYQSVGNYDTFDKCTSLCIELKTELDNLIVYGTIIGILGNQRPSFKEDLIKQLEDIDRLAAANKNLCICGDFNCSFSDNYYYTKDGRNLISNSFAKNSIEIVTAPTEECIDHICISKRFIENSKLQITEWNLDKSLSDHKGIAVQIFK